MEGRCTGANLGSEDLQTEAECLQQCKDLQECQWFTYDQIDGVCYLFSDCGDLDTAGDCAGACWSGQKPCGERKGEIYTTYYLVERDYYSTYIVS